MTGWHRFAEAATLCVSQDSICVGDSAKDQTSSSGGVTVTACRQHCSCVPGVDSVTTT